MKNQKTTLTSLKNLEIWTTGREESSFSAWMILVWTRILAEQPAYETLAFAHVMAFDVIFHVTVYQLFLPIVSFERDFQKFPNKEQAHGILDKIIDRNIRPRMHSLLEFCYVKDPRNGKPIFQNEHFSKILQEIVSEHKKCYYTNYFTATLCFLGVGAIVFFGMQPAK